MQAEQFMCHFPANKWNFRGRESTTEESMKAVRSEASCSVGELIAVGKDFTPEKVQECIQVVSSSMPQMGYRTHRSYATVLAFSLIVIKFN